MAEMKIRDAEAFRVKAASNLDGAVEDFCHIWPMVGEGLMLLKQIAPAIPGIGRFVVYAIEIVTAAGDAAAHALCHDSAGRDDVAL